MQQGDFNFADFQLEEAINSNNPYYIKSKCAPKIRRADKFVLLIGADTYTKTQFVRPEVEACAPQKPRPKSRGTVFQEYS